MLITIINDCRDDNAAGRQVARTSSLFNCPVNFMGVRNDIEAAGNLIDILDALEDREGIILVNVAPRNAEAKHWKNGSPFGYFRYKKTLVISTVDGLALSLVKKLKLTDSIKVLDIPSVTKKLVKKNIISPNLQKHIVDTQFRSFDFLPRIAAYLAKGNDIESKTIPIEEAQNMPRTIWWTDNFGNCKTTILESELKDKKLTIKNEEITHYERLKDVPDKEAAIITGSSGLNGTRFVEIVIQGESACKKFDLSVGDTINLK